MKKVSSGLRITSILIIIAIPVSMMTMSLSVGIISGGPVLHPGFVGFIILGFMISVMAYAVPAVVSLVAALLGLFFWKKPNRVFICCIAAIFLLARETMAIFTLLNAEGEVFAATLALSSFFIINLPLSVCYTIAAFRLRKIAKQANATKTTACTNDS